MEREKSSKKKRGRKTFDIGGSLKEPWREGGK